MSKRVNVYTVRAGTPTINSRMDIYIYLCPISCAIVKAEVNLVPSTMEQECVGVHIPWMKDMPVVAVLGWEPEYKSTPVSSKAWSHILIPRLGHEGW